MDERTLMYLDIAEAIVRGCCDPDECPRCEVIIQAIELWLNWVQEPERTYVVTESQAR